MNVIKKKNAKKSSVISVVIGILLIISFLMTAGDAYADSSLAGPTGLFLTPSPAVCKPGKFGGGLYLQSYSIQRESSTNERSIIVNGLYGISSSVEAGFSKSVDSMQSSFDPGLSLNLKYLFPDSKALKVAAGLVIETDNNSYSSAYIVAGQEIAFFGMGVNFGGHRAYPMNKSHYGGYDFSEMAPNNFFFIAGANFDLKVANLTVEYNSDAFSIGFRVPTIDGYNINLAYISDSDYDLVHKNIYGNSYSRQKVTLGVTGTF